MSTKRGMACILLSASIIMSSGVTASASSVTDAENTKDVGGFIVEELTPVDLSGVDPASIIELPQSSEAMLSEESEFYPQISSDFKNQTIGLSDLKIVEDLTDKLYEGASARADLPYDLITLSDVMGADSSNKAYTINVGSGQILQVELQIPRNPSLDYDLYLYEMNLATNELILVSGSKYFTDANFMSECAGVINNSGVTKTYAILVHPNNNPSPTDYYTINASVGTTRDILEPNENAMFAVEFPTMADTTKITVSAELNTPIDNDWFLVHVEDTSKFSGLLLKGFSENVIVESYAFTTDNHMVKLGSTLDGEVIPIVSGYTYLRISANRNGAFAPDIYNMEFSPALNATKALTLIAVDGYCIRHSNLFDHGIYLRLVTRKSIVEARVLYLSDNDIPAVATDRVRLVFYNPAWDNPLMQYTEGEKTVENSYTCSAFAEVPTLRGYKYDMIRLSIYSDKLGTLVNDHNVILLDHYDNGELDSPCIHNGACGLK